MSWLQRVLGRRSDPAVKPRSRTPPPSPGQPVEPTPWDIEALRGRDAHTLTDTEFEAVKADRADGIKRRPHITPIRRDEYLSPAAEAHHVTTDADGLPNLKLSRHRKQLVLTVDQGMINFRSRTLHRLDIFTFRLRGVSHYEGAVTKTSLQPGTTLRLVREPENQFDPNAVAIYPARGRECLGYVNRQNAARLARRLDAGEEFTAITMSGSPAGHNGDPVTVLIAPPRVLERLRR
ncbi:HIRAN domain-containing protein [Actinotalea ferrariae]|uniref:HIRAN domain-containing protein n=1 Tax=Actinotalea ferrariae TaxID=1386098 RepID=UPI001C8CB58E|nr:HIRAN domain-containing protein [Actinotalea ferrariae]MBX9244319.1 HIRAN domain-containing protein [Actinotalea ferrariae]